MLFRVCLGNLASGWVMAEYDILIKGGTIVDGLRTPRYVSDLAIKDGRIAKIGGLKSATAKRVPVDAGEWRSDI